MVTYISDYKESSNPFKDEYDVDTYMSMDSVVGQVIDIYDVRTFENQNGPGVYILARPSEGGDFFYLCTHSVGITSVLGQQKVTDGLKEDAIRATIVKRKSKTSDRTVYALE